MRCFQTWCDCGEVFLKCKILSLETILNTYIHARTYACTHICTHAHTHTHTEAPAHTSCTRCINELQRAFKGTDRYSYLSSFGGALNEIRDCLPDCDQTPTEGPVQAANQAAWANQNAANFLHCHSDFFSWLLPSDQHSNLAFFPTQHWLVCVRVRACVRASVCASVRVCVLSRLCALVGKGAL